MNENKVHEAEEAIRTSGVRGKTLQPYVTDLQMAEFSTLGGTNLCVFSNADFQLALAIGIITALHALFVDVGTKFLASLKFNVVHSRTRQTHRSES